MRVAISRGVDKYGQKPATNQYEAIYALYRNSQSSLSYSEVFPHSDNESRYMGHDKIYALHKGTSSHVHYR